VRSTALPWAVGSVLFPAAFSNNCPSTDGSVRQIGAPRLDAGYFFSTANGRGGGCARLGCRGNMGVPGFGGSERMVSSHAEDFSCPNCNAKYRLVRVEAEPEPSHGRIECYHCGAPLNGREGRFILKYFLIDRPRRQLKPTRVK
jgi:hypothetical protein